MHFLTSIDAYKQDNFFFWSALQVKIEAIRSKTRRWCRVPTWQLLQAVSAAIKKIPLVTLPPPPVQRWIHLPMEYLVPPRQNPRLKNSKTPKGKNQWDNVIFELHSISTMSWLGLKSQNVNRGCAYSVMNVPICDISCHKFCLMTYIKAIIKGV